MFRSIVLPSVTAFLFAALMLAPHAAFSAGETHPAGWPETLYVVPFLSVMTPADLGADLFDSFIDEVSSAADRHGIRVRILKQDIDTVDRGWLARQHFVTGEIFDYTEERGCCSTEMEVKARIYRYRPGAVEPADEIVVPGEAFFDHDISTPEKERLALANRIARDLARQLMADLAPARR